MRAAPSRCWRGVRDRHCARAAAQETVNYASVSGRVTDPSGAVVPGAQVTARQTDTNLTGEATTDGEGASAFRT